MATTSKTTAKTNTAKTETIDGAANNSADWAAAAQDQFETALNSFGGDFDEIRTKAEELTEQVQARLTATQEHAAQTNARLMEAAQEEVSSTVQLANDLTNAKSFADALTIQQTYWSNLFETRLTNARELTEKSVETARETFAPVATSFGDTKAFEKFFAFPAKA